MRPSMSVSRSCAFLDRSPITQGSRLARKATHVPGLDQSLKVKRNSRKGRPLRALELECASLRAATPHVVPGRRFRRQLGRNRSSTIIMIGTAPHTAQIRRGRNELTGDVRESVSGFFRYSISASSGLLLPLLT